MFLQKNMLIIFPLGCRVSWNEHHVCKTRIFCLLSWFEISVSWEGFSYNREQTINMLTIRSKLTLTLGTTLTHLSYWLGFPSVGLPRHAMWTHTLLYYGELHGNIWLLTSFCGPGVVSSIYCQNLGVTVILIRRSLTNVFCLHFVLLFQFFLVQVCYLSYTYSSVWFGQDDGILVIPTIPDPPLKLGGKEILSEDYLSRVFSLLSLASMSGCCQVQSSLSLSLSSFRISFLYPGNKESYQCLFFSYS